MILVREKLFDISIDGKKVPCVDVRSYERTKALKKNEDIFIEHGRETMKLTPAKLRNKSLILGRKKVKSIVYPDQHYTLLSYKWQPMTEEEILKQYLI
jgi:predicted HTH transcriptional regulator